MLESVAVSMLRLLCQPETSMVPTIEIARNAAISTIVYVRPAPGTLRNCARR
jgi:hypothetical protein